MTKKAGMKKGAEMHAFAGDAGFVVPAPWYDISMEEYVTDALVLAKEESGERDARYTLFTERFGKLAARAKSVRAVKSKLAGHLEPGIIAKVRFVDKGTPQIVDALKAKRLPLTPVDLRLLRELLPDLQAEPDLWRHVARHPFSWNEVLRILGWDPAGAQCSVCGRSPSQFLVARQEFFCADCVSKMGKNRVSYISVDPQK